MGLMSDMHVAMGLSAPTVKASQVPWGWSVPKDGKTGGVDRPLYADDFPYAYEVSSWVYKCVNERATNAAEPPIRAFEYDGKTSVEFEFEVFEKPNPHMTWQELIEYSVSDYDLTGNAYWELVREDKEDPESEIKEIYRLPPQRIRIVPHPKEYIAGYTFEVNEQRKIPFLPHQVAHFKTYHPHSEYYGLSPLRAGRLAVETQVFGARWNKRLLQKSSVPGGLIFLDEDTSPAGRVQIRKEWEDLVQGVERSHNLVVVPNGVRYEKVEMSPSELGFLEGAKLVREEILAIYGVPPIIVGLETQNYATAREQKVTFWQETEKPLLRKWSSRIDHDVMPVGSFCAFDLSGISVFEELRWGLVDELSTAVAGGLISPNEGRNEMNFPIPEDGSGNELYMPVGLVPVGEVPAPMVVRSLPRAELTSKMVTSGRRLPGHMVESSSGPVDQLEGRIKDFLEKVEKRLVKEGWPN